VHDISLDADEQRQTVVEDQPPTVEIRQIRLCTIQQRILCASRGVGQSEPDALRVRFSARANDKGHYRNLGAAWRQIHSGNGLFTVTGDEMKNIILAVLAVSLLSGCATEFIATNDQIAAANEGKLVAYGQAMAACGENAGCQVGVSMAYAARVGDQDFIKPERTAEVLGAWVPFASLGLQAFDMFYGGGPNGTGSAGYVVTGNNNTFSGVGNALEASGGSTVTAPFSSSNSFSWSTGNRDYTIGGTAGEITGDGIVDTYPDTTETSDGETVEVTAD